MVDDPVRTGRPRDRGRDVSRSVLCQLEDIEDGGSAGFTSEVDGKPRMLLAARKGKDVFVYINSCPHIGVPLDFHAGKFLSRDQKHIICSTHGALFEIEDGLCVLGPCRNAYLKAVVVSVEDGSVLIEENQP